MPALRFLSLAAACLLMVNLAEAEAAQTSNNTAVSIDCAKEMNEARTGAGLEPFVLEAEANKKLPIFKEKSTNDYVKAVCDAITNNKDPAKKTQENFKRNGVFAYAVQSGAQGDCSAAVNSWKGGMKVFNGNLPPAYKSNSTAPYDSVEAQSFVALYNPGTKPTVDCAYFTCTTTTTAAPSTTATTKPSTTSTEATAAEEQARRARASSSYPSLGLGVQRNQHSLKPGAADPIDKNNEDTYAKTKVAEDNTNSEEAALAGTSASEGSPTRRLEAKAENVVSGLVCVTYPQALVTGKAPFTQEQWDKIVKPNGSGSPSATVATLLAVAISAFSVLLF